MRCLAHYMASLMVVHTPKKLLVTSTQQTKSRVTTRNNKTFICFLYGAGHQIGAIVGGSEAQENCKQISKATPALKKLRGSSIAA